jgi:hypothetical protein
MTCVSVRQSGESERARDQREKADGGNVFHRAAIVSEMTARGCALLGKRCASLAL